MSRHFPNKATIFIMCVFLLVVGGSITVRGLVDRTLGKELREEASRRLKRIKFAPYGSDDTMSIIEIMVIPGANCWVTLSGLHPSQIMVVPSIDGWGNLEGGGVAKI